MKTNAIRASVKNIAKDVKKTTKTFTTVNTQLQQLKEADSDMSDSQEEDEASHFHTADHNVSKSGFQFAQLTN